MLWKWRGCGARLQRMTEAETRVHADRNKDRHGLSHCRILSCVVFNICILCCWSSCFLYLLVKQLNHKTSSHFQVFNSGLFLSRSEHNPPPPQQKTNEQLKRFQGFKFTVQLEWAWYQETSERLIPVGEDYTGSFMV
ncbi:hypothetical protein INR49_006058 [Caranx melampygus]|nr:hypothetical protein INR49_006058 [Caranx melampygus]